MIVARSIELDRGKRKYSQVNSNERFRIEFFGGTLALLNPILRLDSDPVDAFVRNVLYLCLAYKTWL